MRNNHMPGHGHRSEVCSPNLGAQLMADTKTVHATLTYTAGGREVTEALTATVPAATPWHEWVSTLAERTVDLIEPKGAENGGLSYRLDGTTKSLTILERIADMWHQWTWRGVPFTGN